MRSITPLGSLDRVAGLSNLKIILNYSKSYCLYCIVVEEIKISLKLSIHNIQFKFIIKSSCKILNLRDRHTHEYLMLSQLYTNTFLSTNTLRSDCPGPTASTADEPTSGID